MSGPSQATAGRPFGLIRQERRSPRQLLRYSLTGLWARSLRCSCASLISTPLAAILQRTSGTGHWPLIMLAAAAAMALDFSAAADEYLGWLALEANRSPNTVRAYSHELRRLAGFLAANG